MPFVDKEDLKALLDKTGLINKIISTMVKEIADLGGTNTCGGGTTKEGIKYEITLKVEGNIQ